MNWNIGIIGFGNMAQAMVSGWLKTGAANKENIHVCAAHFEKCSASAEKYGVKAYRTKEEVIEKSDMVLLAIKPYQMEKVIPEIKELLKNKVVVSVVSSWMFDRMETLLCEGTHHISTCPNTPVAVAEGIIIVQDKHSLSEKEHAILMELLTLCRLFQLRR